MIAQKWNGLHFERSNLASIGLRVQLGHHGNKCPAPVPAFSQFVVADVTGLHPINADYCGCDGYVIPHQQLLRAGWYPASISRPRTAFTLEYLDTFHKLTLQGKLAVYDFFLAISRKTDHTGLIKTPVCASSLSDCYPVLPRTLQVRWHATSLVIRQWRYLQMCKRSGRGHDPVGVSGTPRGANAIECPACPQPGRNLPSDWQSRDDCKFVLCI